MIWQCLKLRHCAYGRLGHAHHLENGVHAFLINGERFKSLVEDGWVLVARQYSDDVGKLAHTNVLDGNASGILTPIALAGFAVTEIRISDSTGITDVTSDNGNLINRLRSFKALHGGTPHNAINESWSGSNQKALRLNARCRVSQFKSLDTVIVHVCGLRNGFDWMPEAGLLRNVWADGNIASGQTMSLWAKADPAPIGKKSCVQV